LRRVLITASVEAIEEEALKGCIVLESSLIAENAKLVGVGKEGFSECPSL
jgi:hypothetical protein